MVNTQHLNNMIVIDENSEEYMRPMRIKRKETLPSINEEQAIYCERQFIDFVNGKKEESETIKEVNRYLIEHGLIKPNK